MDISGAPNISLPLETSKIGKALRTILFSLIALFILPILVILLLIFRNAIIRDTIYKVFCMQPLDMNIVKDKGLQEQVWRSESAALYKQALEYQNKEGFCSIATQRCMLRSFNVAAEKENIMNKTNKKPFPIPDIGRAGPDTPENLKSKLLDLMIKEGFEGKLEVDIQRNENHEYSPQDDYLAFQKSMSLVNDSRYRVCVNFLRSALFGPSSYWPHGLMLALMGGHFSPIVHYFEVENEAFVGLFDVNHVYGLCIVPVKRLYQATRTHDIMTGKMRGVIILKTTVQ